MKKYELTFIAERTSWDEYTRTIDAMDEDDAVRKVKENFYSCDLSDIEVKEVT
jgi:hypothetical protein